MKALSKHPIIYQGSVKNVRQVVKPSKSKPGIIWFEFTDDFSVFDYGKMPDAIPGKGQALAIMTAYFFEKLHSAQAWKDIARSEVWSNVKVPLLRDELLNSTEFAKLKQHGMPTHYRGIVNHDGKTVSLHKLKSPSNVIETIASSVRVPEPIFYANKSIYSYNHIHPGLSHFLIPLECVFRFGVPKGSSLLRRLRNFPGYHHLIGLEKEPEEGSWLPRPVVEFFSKLEPMDRMLPAELALNISGLPPLEFMSLYRYTMLLALFSQWIFQKAGMKLWDGKFEFIRINGELKLADAITIDELRLTSKHNVQLSKEPIRQYYKKNQPNFVAALDQAKKLKMHGDDRELAKIVEQDFQCTPDTLEKHFLDTVRDMYIAVTEEVADTGLFGKVKSLTRIVNAFKKYGVDQ